MNASCNDRVCVAFIIHSMRIGGAERSIARLINALDHGRFRPVVICLSETGPAADWIQSPEVPVVEIKKRESGLDYSAIQRLARVLVEYGADIAHSHNWGTLIETTLACRWANTSVHVHAERGSVLGEAMMRGWRMRLRGRAAGWAMRRCNAVVTNAHSVADRIQARCGFPRKRVHVIANGVETPAHPLSSEQVRERKFELGIHENAMVLGSVGRLAAVKGFEVAIAALADLAASGRDVHLLLVGDGPEENKLRLLANELGARQRVHFLGHQEEVGPWLSMFDVYVNTSHSEGMSQSLIEALAAGCPVIATDVGDSARVVGGSSACGALVPPGDAGSLAEKIEELTCPSLRAQYRQNAINRHQKLYSTLAMAAKYAELYENLLFKPRHVQDVLASQATQ